MNANSRIIAISICLLLFIGCLNRYKTINSRLIETDNIHHSYKADQVAPAVGFADGVELFERGRYDSSAVVFTKIVKLDETSWGAWLYLGRINTISGQYDQADSCLKNSFDASGNMPSHKLLIMLAYGENFESQNDYTSAQKYYQSALTIDSTSVVAQEALLRLISYSKN